MKIFVDTNIFLDLILKRDNFGKALIVLNSVEKKLVEGVVLDITLLNIDYIAKKQVVDIRGFLDLINRNFAVIGATNDLIAEALRIDNNDLEDNLQYLGAKKTKCDCIISNDKNFYSPEIEKFTGEVFVQRYAFV